MSRTRDRAADLECLVLAGLECFRSCWFTLRMLESNLGFPGRCRLRACIQRLSRTGRIRTRLHPSGATLYGAHPLPVNHWAGHRAQIIQKTTTRIQNLQRATAHAHLLRTTLQVAGWLDRTYLDPR